MGDFDFLVGSWAVANRRLTERHVGSDEWDEFPGTSVARSFFDGAGSFDEITSCRWEQAFSTDGEQTWETNWIMDNTRTG